MIHRNEGSNIVGGVGMRLPPSGHIFIPATAEDDRVLPVAVQIGDGDALLRLVFDLAPTGGSRSAPARGRDEGLAAEE
jgi:hypothetical protein